MDVSQFRKLNDKEKEIENVHRFSKQNIVWFVSNGKPLDLFVYLHALHK